MRRVASLGYNAITLDDVAHLSDDPWFEPEIRRRNAVFREEFRELFAIAKAHGLRVFITTDFLTTSPAVDARLDTGDVSSRDWFRRLLESFLVDFPEVAGIILRIGESDGHDVADPLRSRLAVRTANEVRALLNHILPVFEKHQRRLIFRTWTVGAHLIGDLITAQRTARPSTGGHCIADARHIDEIRRVGFSVICRLNKPFLSV